MPRTGARVGYEAQLTPRRPLPANERMETVSVDGWDFSILVVVEYEGETANKRATIAATVDSDTHVGTLAAAENAAIQEALNRARNRA